MGTKNVYTAYFLWLIGGYAGLHLLYLGRDRQAFLYWCTFGGYFGIALVKDLFCIPHYVRDANDDPTIMAKLIMRMHKHKTPPFSVMRCISEMIIANSWCYLWMAAMPENDEHFGIYFRYLKYLGPLAAALGTWMVANIGRIEGSFKWSVIGAFLVIPASFYDPAALNLSSMTSAVLLEWKGKQWRRKPYSKRPLCRRLMFLSSGWFLFCSLWVMYIYFNAQVTLKDGKTAKLKDVITHFFTSQMYVEFKKNMTKLYEDAKANGCRKAWHNMMELLDPFGEYHALKVMGLQKGVTQQNLTATYKKLSKEWHPDRHKGANEKELAQEKFIDISTAYEVLSTMKKKRKRKSQQPSLNEEIDDDFDEFHDDL